MHDETATVVPPVMLFQGVFVTSGSPRWKLVAASEQPCAVRSGTGRRGRHAAFYAASRANAAICDRLEGCADYKLATYEQIEDYFRKLAAAVPAG